MGTLYPILGALNKYPADWWTLSEGIAQIVAYVPIYAITAAVLGYGIV